MKDEILGLNKTINKINRYTPTYKKIFYAYLNIRVDETNTNVGTVPRRQTLHWSWNTLLIYRHTHYSRGCRKSTSDRLRWWWHQNILKSIWIVKNSWCAMCLFIYIIGVLMYLCTQVQYTTNVCVGFCQVLILSTPLNNLVLFWSFFP